MGQAKININDVIANLEKLPPADLLGVKLLEEYPPEPGRWLPSAVPKDQISKAALQLVEYTQKCARLHDVLKNLSGTALEGHDVPEFGL